MSKPKIPLLSFGARGTIADSLTFQKRGRGTIVRTKPIPTDPKSPAQLAHRLVYQVAVSEWNSYTTEEKEAWRGVCPGLTPYQCYMRSQLKYAPPVSIDIGSDPIWRWSSQLSGRTYVETNNPANASGILHTVKVYASANMTGLRVGTFYTTDANTLKCRDSEAIGDVEAGAERTFTGLSIIVVDGDYIGCYYSSGLIASDLFGFLAIWSTLGEYIDPGDEATYTLTIGHAISLYGAGEGRA